MKKLRRTFRKFLVVTAVAAAILLLGMQVVLNGRVLTGIVNRVAAGYVDGEVKFASVEASVFRSFPYLNVRVDSASIVGGEEKDTLLSVRVLEASLDYVAAFRGEYRVRLARMVRPRIFAHYYDSTANWDIIRIPSDSTGSDAGSGSVPRIVINSVSLEDSPYVLFTTPRDTVELMVDRCMAEGHEGVLRLDVAAVAFAATRDYGKMRIPIELGADLGIRNVHDGSDISVTGLTTRVAQLEMTGHGDLMLRPDSMYVKAEAEIDRCSVGDIVKEFGENFPDLKKVRTDAVVSLIALCDGWYVPERGALPLLVAEVVVPTASFDYEGIDRESYMSLEASAETDEAGRLDVSLGELMVDAGGMEVMLSGSVADALGKDPQLGLKGFLEARVDTLTRMFTQEMGIVGTGKVKADLNARARMSQLDMYNIYKADIRGNVTVDGLVLNAWDTLSAYVDRASLEIGSKRDRITAEMTVDSLSLAYLESMFVRGRRLYLGAHASDLLKQRGEARFFPFTGTFRAGRLSVRDGADMSVFLIGSEEQFRVVPSTEKDGSPTLYFNGSNKLVGMRESVNRFGFRDLVYSASARKREARREGERRPRRPRGELPSWMTDPDFRRNDIDIRLDESLAKYLREWNLTADLSIGGGRVTSPYFPLKTEFDEAVGTFDGNELEMKSLTIRAGRSDLSAQASLKGIRRALLGRGMLTLDAKVTSEVIDANEMFSAYASGQNYVPDVKTVEENETFEDDDYLEKVEASADSAGVLLILPGNFNANISLEAGNIYYDSLHIDWMASDIAMKQRCLQVTNTVASSNMGDIYFEGFYSTRSKEDLKVGFDLNLVDITAEKVIQLFPAVDTIMPMLKSFKGLLDCELAATSLMDDEMNLLLPSIDGVINIGGKNLSLEGSPELTKIARMLRFKDKKQMAVDNMTVNGMIRDNVLEIFPFIINVDRYTVAASGIHNLDESYKYHISMIKSPLPLKFGVNVWGDSFDKMKFSLGKARYKNVNVPVFTKQLDTVKYNLVGSIHNIFEVGVDRAVEANRSQSLVEDKKAAEQYSPGALTEALGSEEVKIIEEASGEASGEDKKNE